MNGSIRNFFNNFVPNQSRSKFCALAMFWLTSCSNALPQELGPTNQMAQLLLEPQSWQSYTPEERFAMYNNAINFYGNKMERVTDNKSLEHIFNPQLLRLDDIFLSFLNTHPQDPYNSYYLYNIAGHYIRRGEAAMGLWLLRSMYEKFNDLKLPEYSSIHYLILDTLGRLEDNVDYRINAIKKILRHYQKQTSHTSLDKNINSNEQGVWLYRLGKAYETKATGMLYIDREMADRQLKAAMEVYRQFFVIKVESVPEEHNARNIVASKINIYNSRRNWYTHPGLENLIRRVKYAIQSGNAGAVLYLQANGFFVLSSDYRNEVSRGGTNIYLPHFLSDVIQFGSLITESNDEEAWLYSTNWPFHLKTWYLYFQKIHYPALPEIDGNWQWAGIYLGDFY